MPEARDLPLSRWGDEIRRTLVSILRAERPELVFTFDPNGFNAHPDHVAISRFQSIDSPSGFICARIAAMFWYVHSPGATPRSIAAFSAGSPKASQPIGCSTLNPRAAL